MYASDSFSGSKNAARIQAFGAIRAKTNWRELFVARFSPTVGGSWGAVGDGRAKAMVITSNPQQYQGCATH
jgi:hypothetical protein